MGGFEVDESLPELTEPRLSSRYAPGSTWAGWDATH